MSDFAQFYESRKDAVFRAVLVATGNRAGAEDAVAEAFTRAYGQWDVVGAHPNPMGWVLRTALNCQRSWWRRLVREVPGDPPDRAATGRPAAGLSADVRRAVRDLPRRQREVVALRLLADLSAEETGALLRISPATVHVHLHRALANLRGALHEEAGRPTNHCDGDPVVAPNTAKGES